MVGWWTLAMSLIVAALAVAAVILIVRKGRSRFALILAVNALVFAVIGILVNVAVRNDDLSVLEVVILCALPFLFAAVGLMVNAAESRREAPAPTKDEVSG